MAQAENVIPFPLQKITFRPVSVDPAPVDPEPVDWKAAMADYDSWRPHVSLVIKAISLTSSNLKAQVETLEDIDSGRRLEEMLDNFEKCENRFAALSEIFGAAIDRIAAAREVVA